MGAMDGARPTRERATTGQATMDGQTAALSACRRHQALVVLIRLGEAGHERPAGQEVSFRVSMGWGSET